MNAPTPTTGQRCLSPLPLLALATLLATICSAQGKLPKSEKRDLRREMATETAGAKPSKREDNFDAKGGRPNSSDAAARALEKLRDALAVTDDAEWELIAERINKVTAARSSLGTGAGGLRGSLAFAAKGKPGARTGVSAHPEQEALRSALKDQLPDAEIKARLARAHEVLLQNEARLARAQTDLRAVLTVRQEAVAVMAGLLPP